MNSQSVGQPGSEARRRCKQAGRQTTASGVMQIRSGEVINHMSNLRSYTHSSLCQSMALDVSVSAASLV